MGLRRRVAKLEKGLGGRTCCCPIELIEVPEGEPDPTEAGPPAAGPRRPAGRPVCDRCGLPVPPGKVPCIVVRLAVVSADEAAG